MGENAGDPIKKHLWKFGDIAWSFSRDEIKNVLASQVGILDYEPLQNVTSLLQNPLIIYGKSGDFKWCTFGGKSLG